MGVLCRLLSPGPRSWLRDSAIWGRDVVVYASILRSKHRQSQQVQGLLAAAGLQDVSMARVAGGHVRRADVTCAREPKFCRRRRLWIARRHLADRKTIVGAEDGAASARPLFDEQLHKASLIRARFGYRRATRGFD